MMKGSAKLERKDSDEWLCSSTYQPTHEEIVPKSNEKKKPKKKKIAVVVPRKSSVQLLGKTTTTPKPSEVVTIDEVDDVDILNFVSTSKDYSLLNTPTLSMAKMKVISPAIPRTVASIRKLDDFSPPILQTRQSPEQLFAALTPKRRSSLEISLPLKRRKTTENDDPFETEEIEDIEEQGSTNSDISNVFDTLSPIESPVQTPHNSPQKQQKFSLDFISGYEAQFSAFEDTQPQEERIRFEDSPDIFDDLEEPMSIYEESEARDLDLSPLKLAPRIETSPEKRKKVVNFKFFESEEVNSVKKSIRFAEPEEPSLWRKENFIEESCGAHLQNSVFREYAIDVETCGMQFEESNALPGGDEETQKYFDAASCALLSNSPLSDSQEEEIYERDELSGLSARLASLMSSATSERRLLMSDVVFGTVPKEKLVKLELSDNIQSAFGMTILDTSPSSVIISRSSAIRRLANTTSVPCSSLLSPAPFVCDPAPSFHLPPAATTPSSLLASSSSPPPPPTLAPISTIYCIGALLKQSSSSESVTTTRFEKEEGRSVQVVINPPLVSEGAL